MKIVYALSPVSVNRYWRSVCVKGKPLVYKSAEGRAFCEKIAWMTASKVGSLPLFPKGKRVFLNVLYAYSKRPKDADNVLKALLDAFEGILYENDSQIERLCVRRKRDSKDYLEVEIGEIE